MEKKISVILGFLAEITLIYINYDEINQNLFKILTVTSILHFYFMEIDFKYNL